MNTTTLIIIIIFVFLLLWYIVTSNKISKAMIKIDEANSDIDVALTKRYDVLTKMIEVVKGYAKHEKETLFEVIKIRNNMTIEEKNKINNKMNHNLEQIKVLAENYPKLKASENYKTLQLAIADVEEHLQAARRMYNSNVSIYNELIVLIPSNIVANIRGLKKKEFFEATVDKNNIKLNI